MLGIAALWSPSSYPISVIYKRNLNVSQTFKAKSLYIIRPNPSHRKIDISKNKSMLFGLTYGPILILFLCQLLSFRWSLSLVSLSSHISSGPAPTSHHSTPIQHGTQSSNPPTWEKSQPPPFPTFQTSSGVPNLSNTIHTSPSLAIHVTDFLWGSHLCSGTPHLSSWCPGVSFWCAWFPEVGVMLQIPQCVSTMNRTKSEWLSLLMVY
jgi:hypothetical protein